MNHTIVRQISLQKKYIKGDPKFSLYEKIIKGDSGDGVPNILSPDIVFVTEEMRQKPLTKKKLDAWYGVDPKDLEYSSETGQYTPKEGSESDTHGTWREGGWNDPDPNSPTTNIDEGGDFDNENPINESSDEDALNTIEDIERDSNANRIT